MNGRVYDTRTGRFISADPLVQAPKDSQSYNRYSYVRNNPLKYTDPSGYSWLSKLGKKFRKYWRTIAAVAITVFAPCLAPAAWGAWGTVAAGFVGGFAAGLVASGGDFRAALIGGITGAAFAGIGNAYQAGKLGTVGSMEARIAKVTLHGLTGGTSSMAQGGKFGSGFLSASFSDAFAWGAEGASWAQGPAGVVVASLAGGTGSVLGGGKFANGAVTGAFSYAFGNLAERNRNEEKSDDSFMVADATDEAGATVDVIVDAPLEGVYPEALLPIGRLFSWVGRGLGWVGRTLGFGRAAATEALTVSFGHGARHLAGTGLSQGAVEGAIGAQVQAVGRVAGGYWGRVTVQGTTIEYRAYPLENGSIHVGTYYPVP